MLSTFFGDVDSSLMMWHCKNKIFVKKKDFFLDVPYEKGFK
jgi:hypothetical protein